MKTIYIKSEHLNWYETPAFYKVVEQEKETKLVNLDNTEICIDTHDDFNGCVSFVTTKLCNGKYSVIERKEFDAKYIETVKELNALAGCWLIARKARQYLHSFKFGYLQSPSLFFVTK